MDMTKPGVQKPHCEPCASAIALCTGWRPERRVPRPSTVTTCVPSHAYSGKRQALTARWCTFPASCEETITVHAPQPPSPQPSFVPERPRPGKGGRRRGVGGDAIRMVLLAFGSRATLRGSRRVARVGRVVALHTSQVRQQAHVRLAGRNLVSFPVHVEHRRVIIARLHRARWGGRASMSRITMAPLGEIRALGIAFPRVRVRSDETRTASKTAARFQRQRGVNARFVSNSDGREASLLGRHNPPRACAWTATGATRTPTRWRLPVV